jgi:hypothetical protein
MRSGGQRSCIVCGWGQPPILARAAAAGFWRNSLVHTGSSCCPNHCSTAWAPLHCWLAHTNHSPQPMASLPRCLAIPLQ